MVDATEQLQKTASALLSEQKVAVVIGYETSPCGGTRPAFVRSAEDTARLVVNNDSYADLAVYLGKQEVADLGKAAIVVKGCDRRAVSVLEREHVVERDNVYLIGVKCDGVGDPPLSKCGFCEVHDPPDCDVVLGELSGQNAASSEGKYAEVEKLEQLDAAERWEFWRPHLERCIRCYACRQVCPMCYCKRCIVEKTVPRWVESSPHLRGNLAWHIARAFHLTGRCIGCGECERVCPVGIPLGLLNRKMSKLVDQKYSFVAGTSPDEISPFSTFDLDDGDEGIL